MGLIIRNFELQVNEQCSKLHILLQFHRGFPGPSDVSVAEVSVLAQRYYDASNGLHNYIKFHDEVMSAGAQDPGGNHGPPIPPPQEVCHLIQAHGVV